MKLDKRSSNVELLRILLMLFIISSHILSYICDLQNSSSGSTYYLGNLVSSFFIVAVNCFVLISGYFGIKFSISKIIKLEFQVLFYGIIGFFLATISGLHVFNFKTDILYFVPVITRQYWFVSAYIALCLFCPLLNMTISKLTKSQMKIIIGVMIVLFYIIPIIDYSVNAPTLTMDSGYGIVNFICLYFIGRYIRLYYLNQWNHTVCGYIFSCLILFLSNQIMSILLGFYFNSFISYDTVFCLSGAICLFLSFKRLNFHSNIINKLATFCFSAYIMHSSLFFKDILGYAASEIASSSIFRFFLALIVVPLATYIITIPIELLRRFLFGQLEHFLIQTLSKYAPLQAFEKKMLDLEIMHN